MDIKAAQQALTDAVMDRDGVTGTAIGEDSGEPCLKVYVERDGAGGELPDSVGGFPVVVEVSGSFRRL